MTLSHGAGRPLVCGTLLAPLVLAACGGVGYGGSAKPPSTTAATAGTDARGSSGRQVTADESEYKIVLSASSVQAGSYRIDAVNKGTIAHALDENGVRIPCKTGAPNQRLVVVNPTIRNASAQSESARYRPGGRVYAARSRRGAEVSSSAAGRDGSGLLAAPEAFGEARRALAPSSPGLGSRASSIVHLALVDDGARVPGRRHSSVTPDRAAIG